ncbi:TonB-dependent receptor [Sphingomonas sp. CFBP 13733]|nr:TonB-dependent receptor [Sphingomonas sp. CFBP 13733]
MRNAPVIRVLLAGAATLAMTATAQAQQTPPSEAPPAPIEATPTDGAATTAGTAQDDAGQLGDIIVTAQKRATGIQDTPIAMRAFDGDQLIKSGVGDLNGLTRLAPDLNLTTETLFTRISIRGVGSQDVSETADGALTINIDGEYINRPVALNAALFDLERVEILRGPQGTLYGRNSTAGALNVIAAKPLLGDVSGFATVGYGNYDSKTAQAAVNLPLGDKVAVRIAGLHSDHDGYTNNAPGGKGDTGNSDALRASIYAEPFDRLKLYLAGEYVDVNQSAPSQFGVQVSATSPGLVTLPSGAIVPSQFKPTFDRDSYPLADVGFFRTKQYAVRGRADLDLDFATLSYIGGYRDVNVSSRQPLNGYVPAVFTYYNNRIDSDTQSHEIRLAGGKEGAFIWQAGGFYYKESQDIARGLFLPQAGPNGSFLNFFYRPYVDSTSKAAFGQATYWVLPDTLSLTGGIRYTDDQKRARYDNYGFQFNSGPTPPADGSTGAVTTFPRQDSSKVTWNAGVDFKAARDNLLYAKVSTGYKGGGFDNVGDYAPETLTAYEIGSKNRFADRTVEFNVSAFYYKYTNQQVQVLLDTSVGARTLNAGKSRIWGIETDSTFVLSDRDRAHLTFNYLDAKFTDFPGAVSGLNGTFPIDLTGNTPPQAPKVTIAVGYDHTFPIGDGKLVASGFSRFKSQYFLTPFNWEAERQQAYTQTDLSLEYSAPGDRFSIQGFVRNLENERPLGYGFFTGGGINVYNFSFGAPRTYGAQATIKF